MITAIINALIGIAGNIVSAAVTVLPDSPFQFDAPVGEWVGWVNYFVPVGTLVAHMNAILAAALVWYGVRWVLRLGKYIE